MPFISKARLKGYLDDAHYYETRYDREKEEHEDLKTEFRLYKENQELKGKGNGYALDSVIGMLTSIRRQEFRWRPTFDPETGEEDGAEIQSLEG